METARQLRPIYICGSTATGKTSLSIALADALGGEIINADAYQVYQGLENITAAPTPEELSQAPHHLFGVLKTSEEFNAQRFIDLAHPVISDIQSRDKVPIVVGGSGLYLKFLTHGPSALPAADASLRLELESLSDEVLVQKIEALDPEGAAMTNLKNRRYVIRALEICILSGKKMSELKTDWQTKSAAIERDLNGFLLDWDREVLRSRIQKRTQQLIEQGAIDDVQAVLLGSGFSSTSMKTIGVRDIIRYLEGAISIERCQELIYFATCQYAKRQRTWFQKEPWIEPISVCQKTKTESLVERIKQALRMH